MLENPLAHARTRSHTHTHTNTQRKQTHTHTHTDVRGLMQASIEFKHGEHFCGSTHEHVWVRQRSA